MILCQEGYQPGTKIVNGLANGVIDGVVISPRYHDPGSVGAYVGQLRQHSAQAYLLLDPEFHLGLVPGDRVGKLAAYAHYHDDLNWSSFSAGRINQYVDETLSLQVELPVSRLVSPATAIHSLDGWQSSVCMSLFEQTIAAVGQPRARESLLLTLVLGDEILSSAVSIDELLNVLTIMDCRGFYLTIDRQNVGDTVWCGPGQDVALGSLLYMVRMLALNQFEVVCAYTDFPGILMLGAGASAVASGWFKRQRLFDSARFTPSPSGGRQPKDYYASAPLMNWIPLSPDMDILRTAGILGELLSGTPCDAVLDDPRRDERWTLETSVHAFWHAMQQADEDLRGLAPNAQTEYVTERLAKANQAWGAIRDGMRGGPALSVSAHYVRCWESALSAYKERTGI